MSAAGSIEAVPSNNQFLNVHRYGPEGAPQILAVHGLTGHGQRWQVLATQHLAGVSVVAPDLLGHGRSSWAAPWTLDANVTALADLLVREAARPVVVVGHSFGCAVALKLAAARPDLVASLVLLDPAVGLDGAWMANIADDMMASPYYLDRDEARMEKVSGSWSDVDPVELDTELDEHLVELPDGRYGWRMSIPAMMSYWSELAREFALPAHGNSNDIGPCHPHRPAVCDRRADRCTPRATGAAVLACRLRLRSHGGPGAAGGNRSGDPRPTQSGLAVAAITDEQVEAVRALVASIPPGRVSTYGDIASAAGLSSPRVVAWIMRTDSADLPWHRVILASGRPAPHLATRQLELLRAEGVLASDGRVPLDDVRHAFD